ncbi:MAG: MoxR family ATPase, partial [Clostridia bacterium]|nr:MoxR family ATPase [Clostridia bacterium]
PQPFIVIATQNPTGAAGTQMLPDSQMDRFAIRLSLGYPSPADEMAMVIHRQDGNPLKKLQPLMSRADLVLLQAEVESTYLHEAVVKYIVDLITATRHSDDILRGASPRATLAVTAMAKAAAQLRGRDYVVPSDVREVFSWTVAHRLLLSSRAEGEGKTAEEILKDILEHTPAPKMR